MVVVEEVARDGGQPEAPLAGNAARFRSVPPDAHTDLLQQIRRRLALRRVAERLDQVSHVTLRRNVRYLLTFWRESVSLLLRKAGPGQGRLPTVVLNREQALKRLKPLSSFPSL